MVTIDVRGMPIGYEVAGSGPPLVLLHGAVCDRRVWRRQVELLSDEFTVVAWDAPGCGESADPPDDLDMPGFAECLARLIESLDVAPAHVLGHSWGGALALQLAITRPDLVRSLVLVGAYAGWKGSLPPDEVERRLEFALSAAALPRGAFEPATMPGLFSDRMTADVRDELAGVMRDVRPAGTRQMALALAACDLGGALAGIRVPTLVVHGVDDLRAGPLVAAQLHAGIGRSRLVTMPDAGHESYLEDPELFASIVRDFLHEVG